VHTLLNPQIIASEGSDTGVEGCLSLPRLYGDVTRAFRVTVASMNPRGKKITLSGEGLWARAMQHEIDHLDGVLFIDRIERPEDLYRVLVDEDGRRERVPVLAALSEGPGCS
jgi:peptide deformylase